MNTYMQDKIEENRLNKLYNSDSLLQSPMQTVMIDNALILPDMHRLGGGVVDDRGRFVEESAYQYDGINLWGGAYEVQEQETEVFQETVIFIGQIFGHWGNFLFDCLARLWYAISENKPYRLAYCSMQGEEGILKKQRYCEVLELLEIYPDRLIEIRKPARFSSVIIPGLSVFPGTFYTKEFQTVFDKAIFNANKSYNGEYYQKIYFTRTQMKACKELGENRIEDIFRKMGFKVIAPEKLTVTEQICLVNHCSVLASIEGTTSHNIMFAQDHIKQLLLRKQNYINTRQVQFDKLRRIEPQYIDVYYEPFQTFPLNHDAGPFWVGITTSMKKWLKEQSIQRNLKDCLIDSACWGWNAIIYLMKCFYYKYVLKY